MVYNAPSFHVTGVAMFSCVLVSLGFDVTAVIKVKKLCYLSGSPHIGNLAMVGKPSMNRITEPFNGR